ncbi:MAG: efflux transporter outer membrane subunit [Ottowia sp.]|nr:efflux transporter outer membrane subunit [Ottowia sp.]
MNNFGSTLWRYGVFLQVLVVGTLYGCVALPPMDTPPKLAQAKSTDFVKTGEVAWPPARWWRSFYDAQLDTLIARALANAPNMAVAQARVERAASLSFAIKAESGVNVAANGQISRQLYSANSIYPPPLGGSYATSANIDLSLSYDFDFWHRRRSAFEAALGRHAAAQAEAQNAQIVLSTTVAQVYFRWQILNVRIQLMQEIEHCRDVLTAMETKRVQAGIDAANTLHDLIAQAAIPYQTRVQLETQRDQARYQLRFLMGDQQDALTLQVVTLPLIKDAVPAHLSMNLLARRPDIAAARDYVYVSLKDVDSARAAFYPDINITAFLGIKSLNLDTLLRSSSREQGVTPALYLPIFDAGRLHAELASKRADVALAIAQYDQAVQSAVNEVNDAIIRIEGAGREGAALLRQQQARQHDLAMADQRAQAGLIDRRQVLLNQLNVLALQEQEWVRYSKALSAQIDLIKSLGGGYGDVDMQ